MGSYRAIAIDESDEETR